eukprot:scaffold64996_cov68-Attheya_sp.AAC.3
MPIPTASFHTCCVCGLHFHGLCKDDSSSQPFGDASNRCLLCGQSDAPPATQLGSPTPLPPTEIEPPRHSQAELSNRTAASGSVAGEQKFKKVGNPAVKDQFSLVSYDSIRVPLCSLQCKDFYVENF